MRKIWLCVSGYLDSTTPFTPRQCSYLNWNETALNLRYPGISPTLDFISDNPKSWSSLCNDDFFDSSTGWHLDNRGNSCHSNSIHWKLDVLGNLTDITFQ